VGWRRCWDVLAAVLGREAVLGRGRRWVGGRCWVGGDAGTVGLFADG
jgi:hypothetical protein